MKILTVFFGVSGSGKTYASNCLSDGFTLPVIRFDNIYNYDDNSLDFDAVREWVGKYSDCPEFVLDGFLMVPEWFTELRQMFETINLNYIFTDIDFLHESHKQKQAQPEHDWYRKELLYPDPVRDYQASLVNISSFYQAYLRNKQSFDATKLIKRDESGFHDSTEDVLKESVHTAVLRFIDLVSAQPEYQDVEYFGERIRKSDSLSTLTWTAIQKQMAIFTFKDKTVADLGPFNGFFSIKAYKAGAKSVDGFDENGSAVRIYNILTAVNQCWNCKCHQKIVGHPDLFEKNYDIVMALNMLHHVKNMKGQKEYELAVADMFIHANERVILEINDKEIDYICNIAKAKGFEIAGSEFLHKLTPYGWRHVFVYRRVIR